MMIKINFSLLQILTMNPLTQTPRKKLQLIDILPVTLDTFMKTLKNDISEAYNVQFDCLKDKDSDSYDKNSRKGKVNDLIRLREACKKN